MGRSLPCGASAHCQARVEGGRTGAGACAVTRQGPPTSSSGPRALLRACTQAPHAASALPHPTPAPPHLPLRGHQQRGAQPLVLVRLARRRVVQRARAPAAVHIGVCLLLELGALLKGHLQAAVDGRRRGAGAMTAFSRWKEKSYLRMLELVRELLRPMPGDVHRTVSTALATRTPRPTANSRTWLNLRSQSSRLSNTLPAVAAYAQYSLLRSSLVTTSAQ